MASDDLHLTISKPGAIVFSAPVARAAGRPGALHRTPPLPELLGAQLSVLDLDDGSSRPRRSSTSQSTSTYCSVRTVIVGAGADRACRAVELDSAAFRDGGGAASEQGRLPARRRRLRGSTSAYTPGALSFVQRGSRARTSECVQDVHAPSSRCSCGPTWRRSSPSSDTARRGDHASDQPRGVPGVRDGGRATCCSARHAAAQQCCKRMWPRATL